jgi:hypothetical protein
MSNNAASTRAKAPYTHCASLALASRSACTAGRATFNTVLSRKAIPEPRDAAAITQGREEGWHGAEVRVPRMTPTSHAWTTVAIIFLLQ